MLFRKFVCGFRNNMTRFPNHAICFQNSQYVVSRQHVGLYVESKLHGYVDSKPHVFNLTGQLVSTPPVFPTLAATDLGPHYKNLIFHQSRTKTSTKTHIAKRSNKYPNHRFLVHNLHTTEQEKNEKKGEMVFVGWKARP